MHAPLILRLTYFSRSIVLYLGIIALACLVFPHGSYAACQEICDATLGNTGFGIFTLSNNPTGSDNTAFGFFALQSVTSGDENTAVGEGALIRNLTGSYNTAVGWRALVENKTDGNTAVGVAAMSNTTTGYYNTATGATALYTNTGGFYNTATGVDALYFNKSGNYNTATGAQTLINNTTGSNNTACGLNALFQNSSGSNNVALGTGAGGSLTTGNNNIVIGANVPGVAGEANTTRIGKSTQAKTLIGGIYGKTVASGTKVGVVIDSTGKLGTIVSSVRFKEAIKPMDKASEALLNLKPITFRYKRDLDPDGVTQFGLTAEQAEEVCPDLIVRDEEGKASTVRYEAVNAMLLNEFLKEHRRVAEQQSTIAELKTTVAQQQKQIEALVAGLQKVTARVESSEPALRVANDN